MATSTLGSGTLVLAGTTSGTTTVTATAVAGTTTLTLPAATDTLVGKATTDTLTNKTLTGAVMNGTLGATTPSTGAFTTLSATGNVTLGDASTDTLNVGNGDLVKDASGNLLVGDTTTIGTGGKFQVKSSTDTALFKCTSATTFAAIVSNVEDTTARLMAFQYGSGGSPTSVGTVVTNGTSIQLTNVSGITFPATQSASANANTLDDYEEGTWPPVLTFGATNQTITINQATYVKVGRSVTINMQISWSAKSGSGRVFITGLPFAKEGGGTIALLAGCPAGSVTTGAAIFYNVDAGGTTLNFAEQAGDIDSASLAASGSLFCSGTYFV